MKKLLVALLLLISAPALAQVKQSGSVTPTHAVCWTTNGIIQDCGTAAIPYLSTFGVVGSGPSLCQSSGAITGPYNQLCFAATGTGGGFSWTSFGGATGVPSFNINGTIYPFPFSTSGIVGPATTVSGDLACWNNAVGTLLKDCGGATPANTPAVTHEWLNSFTASTGAFTQTQPAFTDISGTVGCGQLPPLTGNVTTSGCAATLGSFTGDVSNTGLATTVKAIQGNAYKAGAYSNGQAPVWVAANSDFEPGSIPTTPVSVANGGTGNSTATAHSLPINEGTSAQANTGAGSSGQCVVGNGSSADPSFVGGCQVLLTTLTASNSTSLTDVGNCNTGGSTGCFTSTYSSYLLVFQNIVPASTGNTAEIQVHVGGATYESSTYLTSATGGTSSGGTASANNSTTFIPLTSSTAFADNLNGELRIYAPSGASKPKHVTGQISYLTSGVANFMNVFGFWNGANSAVDGFQLIMGSGNILTGAIEVYGIK